VPAPTNDKTYQYNYNNRVVDTGVAIDDNRTMLLGIKNALIGFATLPWTVSGSSNSVASGMDATDRWATVADLIWGNGPPLSWIVLRQTGIAAKCEVLIALRANASNGNRLLIRISPAAGFGTANGGTNGSTTTVPTAIDQFSAGSTDTDLQWARVAVGEDRIWNVMQSTDGQVTRVFTRCPTTGKYNWMFRLEKGKNPKAAWTNPVFGNHFYLDGGAWDYSTMTSVATTQGASNGGSGIALYWTGEGTANGLISTQNVGVDQYGLDYDISKVGLYCDDSPDRGFRSRQFDLWLVPIGALDGQTAPTSPDTKTHIVVGDTLMPNDGTSPVLV
jgi:hypothetical protein